MRKVARMTMRPISDAVIPEVGPNQYIGFRLAQARETTGMNQGEFGSEIGASRATISRWERGLSVGKSTLLLYSMRTRVPVEWLEFGKYTPWDLNPEPTGFRKMRRRNAFITTPSYIGLEHSEAA